MNKSAKKSVRKPLQARSKATVDTIIEAAAQILARQGWQGLNTNRIAAVAGVSIGSVYEYFANKEAVLDAIIDQHLTEGEQLLGNASIKAEISIQPKGLIKLIVQSYIALHQQNPRLHRVLSAEVPLRRQHRERISALRKTAIDFVSKQLSSHGGDSQLKAALIIDTADALTHRWIIDEVSGPIDPQRLASELEKMLISYLAP